MTSVRLMQAFLPAPETHFPAVVAVATCIWGIISLWAAASKRPWFIKAMALCLLLSFLVLIPAYGPILYFLLQSAVVVLGVAVWSAKRVRNGLATGYERSSTIHLRFSLRELLFITVFLAIFLSILARMDWHPPMVWASLFVAGLTSGIVTLLAAWVSLPRPTWSKRVRDVVLAMLLTTISAIPAVATNRLLLSFPDWGRTPRAAYDPAWIILLLGILFGIYTWLMLYSMASRNAGHTGYRWLSRLALLGWSMVLVAPCVDLYLALPPMSTPPEPMLVEDNGFEEINEAAELYVSHAAIDDPAQATLGQLRLGLKQNAETLAAIRRGLSKTCVRELAYDKDVSWGSIGAQAHRIRYLARLLMAEGELAEREGRIDDAIASYVDLVRLSRATANGGLAVDALVARAIEAMAIEGIAGLRDRLSSLQRGYLTKVLVDLDRQREDHQTVLQRDMAWGQAVYGWRALLSDVLEQIEAVWKAIEKSLQRVEAGTRLLIVEFAIEDYKHEQGRLPHGLGDLKLDTDLLRDPFSPHGALLKYGLDHNDFLVYSVGADGDEDGGRPPEDGWIGDGDYRLDSLDPSEAE